MERYYVLRDSSGSILALNTDREKIRALFFKTPYSEIWIMNTTNGFVTEFFCFLSAASSVTLPSW
jgi:hypothetical protein